MKKVFIWILVLASLLSLCACNKTEAPEAKPAPTPVVTPTPIPEPTPTPEPASEPGIVRADGLGLVWKSYSRGDKVTVIGKWNGYYVIEDAEHDQLVDERFVRLSSVEAPEIEDGWAQDDTVVYSSAMLSGEPLAVLKLNTELKIVDVNGGWMYIEWAEGSGYVSADSISYSYIRRNYGGGGGNSGGGGGQDGSDVNLGDLAAKSADFRVSLLGAYSGPEFEPISACEASILSDKTDGYMAILSRGTEVKVTATNDREATLYFDGELISVPRWAIRMSTEEEYTPWTAYTDDDATAYLDYLLSKEFKVFDINDTVEVVDEFTELGLYLVKIEEGFGYIPMDMLSAEEYTVRYYGGGGGNGGGDSGAWTPPML